jgi:hypothetical protein
MPKDKINEDKLENTEEADAARARAAAQAKEIKQKEERKGTHSPQPPLTLHYNPPLLATCHSSHTTLLLPFILSCPFPVHTLSLRPARPSL